MPACTLDSLDSAGSCPTKELPNAFDGNELELLRGYTRIGGDLPIPYDALDLSPLACLEVVDGELTVENGSSLTSFDGLEGLRKVGSLYLSDLPQLASTRGLSGVREIEGGVEMWNLPKLREIEAPTELDVLGGSITAIGLSGLEHWDAPIGPTEITGSIQLADIAPTAVIDAFAEVERVTEWISVGADYMPSPPAGARVHLPALREVGAITLFEVQPEVVASLSALVEIDHLHIARYGGSDLTGLSGVQGMVSLQISQAPSLRSLAGLDGLRSLTGLTLIDAPMLTSLDGLALQTLPDYLDDEDDVYSSPPGIYIAQCPALADVSALASITSDHLDGLGLSDLPALTEVPSWPALRRLGRVELSNTGITDLDGFAGVETLKFSLLTDGVFEIYENFELTLTDNPVLADISGLTASATSAGSWTDIVVARNPMLPSCSVEALRTALGAIGRTDGTYDVSDNDDTTVCE
ncbi:MAG TPA: hypothetical protein VG755_25085 [Nannocystaceae bacterium]|nr:hypothetical protein [Nannocystaceae bacterium]